ncbi:MAG TPA: hypothetical protein VGL58_11910 [Caulobacteraceae bacterium]|jgi:Arc/MetJ-type ribon-helix-helix transcriptional regulator
MSGSGKIVVAVEHDHLTLIQRIVAAGEFASPSEVIGEALRSWLHTHKLHGGAHSAERLRQSVRSWRGLPPEPVERVELMFDARDAKA